MRQQVRNLVSEQRCAAWLQHNERQPPIQYRPQCMHRRPQLVLGEVAHPVVIQRTATANVAGGQSNAVAGRLKHFDGRLRGPWREMVVEGVRPQHTRCTSARTIASQSGPTCLCARRSGAIPRVLRHGPMIVTNFGRPRLRPPSTSSMNVTFATPRAAQKSSSTRRWFDTCRRDL